MVTPVKLIAAWSTCAALWVGECCPAAHASSDYDAPELRVAGGEEVPECGFAPVAFTRSCSATLVHPELIFYASHCGKPTNISLTHKQSGGGISLDVGFCKTYGGRFNPASDFAFCKLNTPVTEIPPIPVAFGCEVDAIKEGLDIVHVGFGASGGSGTGSKGFGTKRWGKNTLGKLSEEGEFAVVETSPGKVVSCAGDSGGPLLTRLSDDTWRVIGIASTIEGGCNSGRAYNHYAFAPAGVAWVEKESGVDITPCFDPDGTWNPTEDCGKFFKGDHEGHGSWDNKCEGTPVSGFSETCGPPFGGGGGDDDDASDDKGSDKDDDAGDDNGSDKDDDAGDDKGSDKDDDAGDDKGSDKDDDAGDDKDDDAGDDKGSDKDDDAGKDKGSGKDKDDDASKGKDDGSAKDKDDVSGCSMQSRGGPAGLTLALLGLVSLRRRRRR